jgi:DNA adenine methylase
VSELQTAYAATPPLAEGATPDRDPIDAVAATTSQEATYYWTRKRFNALPATERTGPAAAALFYFLNRTCFRGVYREGPRGFNVPFGHYKATQILDAEHVRAVSAALVEADVQFSVADFSVPLAAAGGPQDHVYLDPPYLPVTATSFTGYTADGFDAAQHEALFAAARAAGARGATFLLSNADAPVLTTAFPAPAYWTSKVSARRAIHSKDPGATAMEVLIRNYG